MNATPPIIGEISVCICTHRRPESLAALLSALARQTHAPAEVVVVDNDANGSARTVAEHASSPFPLRYAIEPQQNIALARNRTVTLAGGEWLALIDDDELPDEHWLRRMAETATAHRADGVLGPVIPVLPDGAPGWIRRGDFYARRRFATGTEVPRNELRTSNLLLRADLVRRERGPFDARFGLTGGEDGDLLSRLQLGGAKLVWCDEAVVVEVIGRERLDLGWLLQRSFRGANNFAEHLLAGRYGPVRSWTRPLLVARSLTALALALPATLLALPFGRHRAVHWLRLAAAQTGKLAALAGLRHEEYRTRR